MKDIKDKVEIGLQTFESEDDYVEDDIKRITMLEQLRVLGVPSCNSTTLKKMLNLIANKIGYSTANPIDIELSAGVKTIIEYQYQQKLRHISIF